PERVLVRRAEPHARELAEQIARRRRAPERLLEQRDPLVQRRRRIRMKRVARRRRPRRIDRKVLEDRLERPRVRERTRDLRPVSAVRLRLLAARALYPSLRDRNVFAPRLSQRERVIERH